MNNTLQPVPGASVPENSWVDPETGLLWFQKSYDGTHKMFKEMPTVYFMNEKYFVKTSHNSDTFYVCYKETPKSCILFPVVNSRK